MRSDKIPARLFERGEKMLSSYFITVAMQHGYTREAATEIFLGLSCVRVFTVRSGINFYEFTQDYMLYRPFSGEGGAEYSTSGGNHRKAKSKISAKTKAKPALL